MTARSRRQIEDLPARRRRLIDVVYNGVDFNFYPPPPRGTSSGAGRYLVFLGRLGEVKNPAGAIRIARKANLPIVLAGEPVEADDQRYFDSAVRPLLDGRQARWIGPVDDRGKRKLLRDAAALLFPIQWEEAFGIVMIEAMACGVPVLAYERGAVAEVVEPGITGYYADSEKELARLVRPALSLNREEIRERARRRFSREAMAAAYLNVYESALDGFAEAAGARKSERN